MPTFIRNHEIFTRNFQFLVTIPKQALFYVLSLHMQIYHHGVFYYHQVSNISRTLVGNKIVDHSDLVGALPVGAAPTTSSFST